MLKPVLPQLQTTFIKALNDKTLAVREKAVEALTLFTTLHTKVDLLFTELRNGVKNNEDNTIRLEAFRFSGYNSLIGSRKQISLSFHRSSQ